MVFKECGYLYSSVGEEGEMRELLEVLSVLWLAMEVYRMSLAIEFVIKLERFMETASWPSLCPYQHYGCTQTNAGTYMERNWKVRGDGTSMTISL